MTQGAKYAEGLIREAYYSVENGDLRQAWEKLEEALDISDLYPDAHNELSIIHGKTGRFADAYYHAVRAVELAPRNPKFHLAMAAVQLILKEYDEALTEAYTALELDPDYASGYLIVSHILQKKGRPIQEVRKQREIAIAIYQHTGRRADGSPLQKDDIQNFTASVDRWLTWPERVESFEIGSIKWAWRQLKKHPAALFTNRTLLEALLMPLIRWNSALVLPIAGFFGVITLEPPIAERPYLITIGLLLFLSGMIARKIVLNPRLRYNLAKSELRLNPQMVRVMVSIPKSAGVGMVAYSLGTMVHQAFTLYEIIAAVLSIALLIGASISGLKKSAWYPVSNTQDFSIDDKTYTNHTYGFSVSIPEDWEIRTGKMMPGILVVFTSPDYEVSINIAVNAIRIPKPSVLPIIDFAEGYVQSIEAGLKPHEKGLKIELAVSPDCEDFPAIVVDYPFQGRHHRKVALFLKVNSYSGYEYLFTYGAPEDKFERYEYGIHHCLSTFSLASFTDRLVVAQE